MVECGRLVLTVGSVNHNLGTVRSRWKPERDHTDLKYKPDGRDRNTERCIAVNVATCTIIEGSHHECCLLQRNLSNAD